MKQCRHNFAFDPSCTDGVRYECHTCGMAYTVRMDTAARPVYVDSTSAEHGRWYALNGWQMENSARVRF